MQVDRDVFANGGVGTAAGLDGGDSLGRESFVAGEEFGVLAGRRRKYSAKRKWGHCKGKIRSTE